MKKICSRLPRADMRVIALLFVAAHLPGMAMANSLGVGGSEQVIRPSGPFAEILLWIQQEQREFYRSMTQALTSMRDGGPGMWALIGLSFAYGILHAAGPGHGKVVISTYMVANEVQLRRGIVLSFASAAMQALVAIIAIGLLVSVLRGVGIRQADLTRNLEIASYAAVMLLGLWLLWRKVKAAFFPERKAAALSAAVVSPAVHHKAGGHHHHDGHGHGHHDHGHGHSDGIGHGHHDHRHHGHNHAPGEVCSECGHAHMPDPAMLGGQMGLREMWSAVFAVGLRPCTGALIVLTFSFLNGLYLAGILSAFAMAVGTAITVSAIASFAVLAKSTALRLTDKTAIAGQVGQWIEIAGAFVIFLLGAVLLSAALAA